MTQQKNELTIKEAARHCKRAIPTIKSWINHKTRPLVVRRENYRTIYINKETIDLYCKGMRPQGRPSILPAYQILIELRKKCSVREISLKYKVTENAVWIALSEGKKKCTTLAVNQKQRTK